MAQAQSVDARNSSNLQNNKLVTAKRMKRMGYLSRTQMLTGSPCPASDSASPGADPRPDLLVIEFWLSPWAERPSSACPGPELRRRRARDRGQPRHSHGTPGAAHWRQAPAEDHSSFPGSRDDARRRVHRATRGHPPGRRAVPLLANPLLDDLDKELERRGHRFCRYDCNIYGRSQAAGERVMASVVAFLEGKLRLKVNQAKSAVAPVGERSFLGHRLLPGGRLGLAPKSLTRAKERLRRITRRNRGIALERMIAEVNSFTTGWVTYFRHAACKEALREADEWLRRKLRCVRLKL